MPATAEMTRDPDLAWEVLPFFPRQGEWSAEDYFLLNRLTNHFIELNGGRVEVMEMPTRKHQDITFAMARRLKAHGRQSGSGQAVMAPYPVYLTDTLYREPDVVFVLAEHESWLHEEYADGADLVVEVLSQDRNRDLVTKRREYATAGIREYWLIDPAEQRITVLALIRGQYEVHATAGLNEMAPSSLLAGFEVSFADLLRD